MVKLRTPGDLDRYDLQCNVTFEYVHVCISTVDTTEEGGFHITTFHSVPHEAIPQSTRRDLH